MYKIQFDIFNSFDIIMKYKWRRIEVVITRLTRNQLAGKTGPWVRIPPSPPTFNMEEK